MGNKKYIDTLIACGMLENYSGFESEINALKHIDVDIKEVIKIARYDKEILRLSIIILSLILNYFGKEDLEEFNGEFKIALSTYKKYLSLDMVRYVLLGIIRNIRRYCSSVENVIEELKDLNLVHDINLKIKNENYTLKHDLWKSSFEIVKEGDVLCKKVKAVYIKDGDILYYDDNRKEEDYEMKIVCNGIVEGLRAYG